ncbi:MAG TPA: T9SS type A sorting domain-containing protein [Bacteroidia bacterium]|nr:T9SS type A sorting domain-containing protein [Bacteroidia bacterium]
MKNKITYLTIAFFALFTFSAKAQPGSTPIFPYYQNFDTLIATQTIEGQGGWYVDLIPLGIISPIEVSTNRGINGTQSMSINLNDNITTDSTTSPLIGPLTSNTTFGFSYRIVNAAGQAHHLNGNAGLKILFKQNVSFQWNLVDSISVTNHTDSAEYQRVEVPIGTFNNMSGNFRIAFYQGFPGDDFFIDIDSVVVYDPTIITNMSDIMAKHNVLISINDLNQISIQQFAHPYQSSVYNIYNLEGKLVHSSLLKSNNTIIDASQWNKGIYIVEVNNSKQKIMVK